MKLAQQQVRGETYLALNGDSFFATDLALVVDIHTQRRAVAKDEEAKAAQAVSGIVKDLVAKRMQIRTKMTERYKVEF